MRKLLSVFIALIGLSAVGGGVGLITNSTGIPLSDLQGSMFSSYLWPGIILATIIGGTNIAAAIMLWRQSSYHLEMMSIAGFGLLIWLFTEVCIVGYHSFLQVLYYILGIVILISVMIMLKKDNFIKS